VAFQYFCHQRVHPSATSRNQSEDITTVALFLEGAVDRLDLPFHSTNPIQQLRLLPDGMRHEASLGWT
jgi:hypothetical protein